MQNKAKRTLYLTEIDHSQQLKSARSFPNDKLVVIAQTLAINSSKIRCRVVNLHTDYLWTCKTYVQIEWEVTSIE